MEDNNELFLITSIKSRGKEYMLYSDGNLYEELPDGEIIVLDKFNPKNQKIIKRVMLKLSSGKTDVIRCKQMKTKNIPKNSKNI